MHTSSGKTLLPRQDQPAPKLVPVAPGALVATARSVTGTLQQDVRVSQRFHVRTDEPEHLGGDDSAPSPHELLPAALAACVGTQLLMYARTRAWDLGDLTVDVEYDHRAVPRHFTVSVDFGATLTTDQLERLEKVVRACPVRKALAGGATFAERLQTPTERVPS
jgi:putative redox protein